MYGLGVIGVRQQTLSAYSDELKGGSDTVLGTILAMERCGTVVIGSLKAIGTSAILKEDRLESGLSLGICTGYGIEPSLDGSVLNGLRLVLELDSLMAG